MKLRLPEKGLPVGMPYKVCEMGVDLPAQFLHDLRSLDDQLYVIWHPYRILWDDMVNDYQGEIIDPRYHIGVNSARCGELVMGHVLTNGQDVPTPDGNWHVWRWCEPASAWAHVIAIESKDPMYQRLLVKRLWLQAMYNDKFGAKGYQKLMEQADLDEREKLQNEKSDLMNEISKANSGMMSKVRDNFEHGRTEATRPMKETIVSAPGLSNKSKMVRPATDREGGMVLPEGFSDE